MALFEKTMHFFHYLSDHDSTSLALIAGLAIIMACTCAPVIVTGSSMEPTAKDQSFALSKKVSSSSVNIKRGDIVSLHSHEKNVLMLKRVIGVEGDEISFQDGYVILNGQKLEENYLTENTETYCSKSFVVPEGHVFVLGDNRSNSVDSRNLGQPYIATKDITGIIFGIVSPQGSRYIGRLGICITYICLLYIITAFFEYLFLLGKRWCLQKNKVLLLSRQGSQSRENSNASLENV